MNSLDVYNLAEPLIDGNREREFYLNKLPAVMTVLMEEVKFLNNSLRRRAGKEVIDKVVVVQSNEQEIELEEFVARAVMPYGVAGVLLLTDNPSLAINYRNFFYYKLSSPIIAEQVKIIDVYGGD